MSNEREVLATAKFSAVSGDEKYTAVLELIPSGCTAYGNRHALLFSTHEDGKRLGMEQCFDARYDRRFNTVETFKANALDFVREHLRDDFTITPIE